MLLHNNPICNSCILETSNYREYIMHHYLSSSYNNHHRLVKAMSNSSTGIIVVFVSKHLQKQCCNCNTVRVPSRELTYPTWGKGKSSSNMPYKGDMLVPWRVSFLLSDGIAVSHPCQRIAGPLRGAANKIDKFSELRGKANTDYRMLALSR